MASNRIYDPPSKHWAEIPRLLNVAGFDKLSKQSYDALRDTNNKIAQSHKNTLNSQNVNIWNNTNSFVSFLSSSGPWGSGVSNWTFYRQVQSEFVPNVLTTSQIDSYITYVENTSLESRESDSNAATERIIEEINNSQYGYIEGDNSADRSQKIKIYLQENKTDSKKSNNNTLGLRTDIGFVGVPKTVAGTPYSASLTNKTGQTGTFEGGDILHDPKNAIAGELDLNYNPNTGKFEASSTFLAKLLTDVEPVEISDIALDTNNIQGRTASDFYGRNAPNKMSSFKTGTAAPVGMNNKNPHCFGPHIVKCKTSSKVETIRVVNRSNISFKRGEIVTVHKIDGEFIIGKYTSDNIVQLPPRPGRWIFSQFYADSDEYFRTMVLPPLIARPSITPEEVIQLYRKKYYYAYSTFMSNEPVGNNYDNSWVEGTIFPYYPWEVFDLIQETQAEVGDDGEVTTPSQLLTFFNKINVTIPPQGQTGGQFDQIYYPLFWGPMFPGGMTNVVNRLTSPRSGPNNRWKCNFTDKNEVPAFAAMPNNLAQYSVELIRKFNQEQAHLSYWPYGHLNMSNVNYPFYPNYRSDYPVYGSGFVQPNDPLTIQFSLLSAELVGASDTVANYYAPWWPDRIHGSVSRSDVIRAFNTSSASILNRVLEQSGSTQRYGEGSILAQKTLARRSASPPAGLLNREGSFLNGAGVTNISPCLPYDLYVQYEPLNTPVGALTMWGGDLALYTPYRGSNGVGITAARLIMNQGSGGSWTATFNTTEQFGMKGRWFGGGGGGNIEVTILGALLGWSTDNRGRRIEGVVPTWGTRGNDNIDQFGTAAIHVQAWDYWPEEQTVWIPQYFTCLHFNPTFPGSNGPYDRAVERPEKIKVANYANAVRRPYSDEWESLPQEDIYYFPPKTDVDYRVPTYGETKSFTNQNQTLSSFPAYATSTSAGALVDLRFLSTVPASGYGNDGVTVPAGATINHSTILRTEPLWNIDISRRGKLVTKYGYFYHKRVIGVKWTTLTLMPDSTIPNETYPWADNFAEDDEFELPGGVIVQYKSANPNRFIVKLYRIQDLITKHLGSMPVGGDISYNPVVTQNLTYAYMGSGFLPSDFPQNLGKQFIIKPKNGGPSRYIKFTEGLCYDALEWDAGPKPRSNRTRLTSSSGEGQDRIYSKKSTSLQISGNSDAKYKGQYELYFHVHNDIMFVLHDEPEYTTGPQLTNHFIVNIA